MPNINITVREKIAHTISDTCIVCGNSDYVAVFDLDAEWDAYETKTARFIWGGTFTDVPFTGNECPVPVIPDAVSVLVGVYAGELRTTTAAAVEVRRSILGGSETESEPSQEIKDAFGKMLAGKIDAPQTAQVGEVLTVEEVDADGKPKKWKTAPAAAEQKQANWAQNDETAADYVKNRPGGYTAKTELTIMDDLLDANKRLDFAVDEGRKYNVRIGERETIEAIGTKETITEGKQTLEIIYIGSATYSEIVTGAVSSYWFIATAGITQLMCNGEYIGERILITSLADTIVKIPEKYLDMPKDTKPIGEYFATSDDDDLSDVEAPDHIKLIRVHCIGVNMVKLPFKAQTNYEVINHGNNILNAKQESTVVGLIPPLYTCLLSSGRQKIVSEPYNDADYGMYKYRNNGGSGYINCGVVIDANNEAYPNGSGYVAGVIIAVYDLTVNSSMMLIKRRGYVTVKIDTAPSDSSSQAITNNDGYIKIDNASGRTGIRKYIGSDSEFHRAAYVHSVNETEMTAKIELL